MPLLVLLLTSAAAVRYLASTSTALRSIGSTARVFADSWHLGQKRVKKYDCLLVVVSVVSMRRMIEGSA